MNTTKGVALITGASEGIGREMAKLLAKEGRSLVLVARNQARLEELANQIAGSGNKRPLVIGKDLADPNAVAEIMDTVYENELHVEMLVNNAGYTEFGPFAEMDEDRVKAMIQVMLTSLTQLTGRVLPDMLQRKKGWILNVASTGALLPCPNLAVYAAIKTYVLSFTEALAIEIRGTGVTATTLLPGNTSSQFAKRSGMTKTLISTTLPMKPVTVAKIGLRAMKKGRRHVVAGCRNRIFLGLVTHLPRCLREKTTNCFLKY